jgi:hypothetical protein
MNTNRKLAAIPAVILTVFLASAASQSQAANSFTDAFTNGKGGLAFRYRLESVDQDGFDKNALASTIRARLNFRTADVRGWGVFAEYDFVETIGWDDYNAGAGNTPDKTQYPVVADPTGPDLNQVYISWKIAGGSEFRAGRQRIIYDNARFVGNVGWRQNEQTYDAVSYRFKNKSGVDVQFAYIGNVNRIFGDEVEAGDHEMDTIIGNASKNWENIGKLTAYYYGIDNADVAAFSTNTYGVRFSGNRDAGSAKLGYIAEYAHQLDAANNPVDYSADYWRFDLSATFGGVTPYIAYESLGGDDSRDGAMFRTPLATLHAFNGWADKFLTTPPAGLNDAMIGIKGTLATRWKWNMVYHDFDAQSGSASYGQELDASIATKFADHFGVLFKAAWFDGNETSGPPDTVKLWVQLVANF